MKLFLLMAALGSIAAAQTPGRYSATTGDVVLSGAGTKFTIQQPATNGKQVSLEVAVVYCSVACNTTQEQNGAAATTTAGTASCLLPTCPGTPATATVFTASNVGSGTAAGGIIRIPAATDRVIDLSQVKLGNGGTGNNYTVIISSITGTANITFIWSEK